MFDPTLATAALTPRERKAMREAQELYGRGQTMGLRKIVSMQGCERVGLVRRLHAHGLISDWVLTKAGLAWRP